MSTPESVSLLIDGPAGKIELDLSDPGATRRTLALIAHPHPLMGGTKDNKVVTTLARTLHALGAVTLRPNFRGVGRSMGTHDEGRGEIEDMVAVVNYARLEYGDLPLICAGFSFGTFVQVRARALLQPQQLILVAPAVNRMANDSVPEGTLVIHGEVDDVVALADVFAWARPQNLPVVVIPGGEHFFHGRLHLLRLVVTRYCNA